VRICSGARLLALHLPRAAAPPRRRLLFLRPPHACSPAPPLPPPRGRGGCTTGCGKLLECPPLLSPFCRSRCRSATCYTGRAVYKGESTGDAVTLVVLVITRQAAVWQQAFSSLLPPCVPFSSQKEKKASLGVQCIGHAMCGTSVLEYLHGHMTCFVIVSDIRGEQYTTRVIDAGTPPPPPCGCWLSASLEKSTLVYSGRANCLDTEQSISESTRNEIIILLCTLFDFF
jgi:hypothetical protein